MKIALLGDIALCGVYDLTKNRDLKRKLQLISDYLAGFDYVVGNLESPFSVRQKPYGAKSAYLYTSIENVDVLKFLHINAVNIANNHFFDFGKEGFETSIRLLNDVDIEWFGADGKHLSIKRGDNELLFYGFCCYSTNPQGLAKCHGAQGINRLNAKEVLGILNDNKSLESLPIFSIHSGIEHVNYPSLEQIKLARMLADVTPYVFYGHHPHVIQGVERYKGAIMAHSLGNFIFDGSKGDKFRPQSALSEDNRRGMILELTIEKNQVCNCKETFIHIGADGEISFLENELENLLSYNNAITKSFDNPIEYERCRKMQRMEYVRGRIQQRNFEWFLQHLRFRYFHLAFSNHMNKNLYKKNIELFCSSND